jgi:hypothetical protein
MSTPSMPSLSPNLDAFLGAAFARRVLRLAAEDAAAHILAEREGVAVEPRVKLTAAGVAPSGGIVAAADSITPGAPGDPGTSAAPLAQASSVPSAEQITLYHRLRLNAPMLPDDSVPPLPISTTAHALQLIAANSFKKLKYIGAVAARQLGGSTAVGDADAEVAMEQPSTSTAGASTSSPAAAAENPRGQHSAAYGQGMWARHPLLVGEFGTAHSVKALMRVLKDAHDLIVLDAARVPAAATLLATNATPQAAAAVFAVLSARGPNEVAAAEGRKRRESAVAAIKGLVRTVTQGGVAPAVIESAASGVGAVLNLGDEGDTVHRDDYVMPLAPTAAEVAGKTHGKSGFTFNGRGGAAARRMAKRDEGMRRVEQVLRSQHTDEARAKAVESREVMAAMRLHREREERTIANKASTAANAAGARRPRSEANEFDDLASLQF